MINVGFLTFAFFVGLISFFNPCGTAILVSYLFGFFSKKEKQKNAEKRIFSAMVGGVFLTLGILCVFIFLGSAFTIFGRELAAYIPYFVAIMGALLVFVGISILLHKNFFFNIPIRSTVDLSSNFGFFKYGVMYSLASFGCELPLFLTVIFGAVSFGTIYDGILSFFAYGLASGIATIILMFFVATSKEAVMKFFKKILPYMETVNAIILILVGIYLILFQFYTGNLALLHLV